jgi:hypothetical protein
MIDSFAMTPHDAPERVARALDRLQIELPSWGFSDTR